jgi:hypothetical protein
VTRDDRLWTKRELAAFLGVGVRTLQRMAVPRVQLPTTGRRPIVRYDPEQVKDWLNTKRTRALHPAG